MQINLGVCLNMPETRTLRERVNQGWRPGEIKPCNEGMRKVDTNGRPITIPVLVRSK